MPGSTQLAIAGGLGGILAISAIGEFFGLGVALLWSRQG